MIVLAGAEWSARKHLDSETQRRGVTAEKTL
jgi:hypothetical protein